MFENISKLTFVATVVVLAALGTTTAMTHQQSFSQSSRASEEACGPGFQLNKGRCEAPAEEIRSETCEGVGGRLLTFPGGEILCAEFERTEIVNDAEECESLANDAGLRGVFIPLQTCNLFRVFGDPVPVSGFSCVNVGGQLNGEVCSKNPGNGNRA